MYTLGRALVIIVPAHCSDVILSTMGIKSTASRLFIQAQIKGNIKVPASLDFLGAIHRWPVNSPHKGPVTRKMFPFDDAIMIRLGRRQWYDKCRVWNVGTTCELRLVHDDIMAWKHYPYYWPFVREILRPQKSQRDSNAELLCLCLC